MKDPKETADNLSANFDKLMGTYTRMFEMCLEALKPETPIRRRGEVRMALEAYLGNKPGDKPDTK